MVTKQDRQSAPCSTPRPLNKRSRASHGAVHFWGSRKIAIIIDGWYMRRRVSKLKCFNYTGSEIKKYCLKHLRPDDYLYRIFYYDTAPLEKKGHNPLTQRAIDFSRTETAKHQKELLASLKRTPWIAVRLGVTTWPDKRWIINPRKTKEILQGKLKIDDLKEEDVKPQILQKAVDMKMGLDIASLAYKRLVDLIIVISGDSDIVPALKLARVEGLQVCLDPMWGNIADELYEHVDFLRTKIPKPPK